MVTAADLVQREPDCVRSSDSLTEVARKFRDLGVCALPACHENGAFEGTVTCWSIVHDCLALGRDPDAMTAADLLGVRPPTVEAGSSPEEVLVAMTQHHSRSMTVVHDGRLVGVLSQADVVRAVPTLALGRWPRT